MAKRRSTAEAMQLGLCLQCGRAYPVRVDSAHRFQPVGTDGRCLCGSHEFTLAADADRDSVQPPRRVSEKD